VSSEPGSSVGTGGTLCSGRPGGIGDFVGLPGGDVGTVGGRDVGLVGGWAVGLVGGGLVGKVGHGGEQSRPPRGAVKPSTSAGSGSYDGIGGGVTTWSVGSGSAVGGVDGGGEDGGRGVGLVGYVGHGGEQSRSPRQAANESVSSGSGSSGGIVGGLIDGSPDGGLLVGGVDGVDGVDGVGGRTVGVLVGVAVGQVGGQCLPPDWPPDWPGRQWPAFAACAGAAVARAMPASRPAAASAEPNDRERI
jgi:hypothetical protein